MADGTENDTPHPHVVGASGGLVSLPLIKDAASSYGMSAAAFCFTFQSVAMPQPHTEPEFVACVIVAKEHGLNPLTKEIYFMRDKHGKIQAIVGVDGWIKKCNEHPKFDGLEFDDRIGADGHMIAMTCSIYRKDRSRPIRVTEYMAECLQPPRNGRPGPWQSVPNRMLRNRTLCQAARVAFGFAGIMDRDEFDAWMAMKDVTPRVAPSLVAKKDASPPSLADAIPDGDASEAPSAAEDRTETFDQQAVLREIERELIKRPADAEAIRAEFANAIRQMDDDGRQAALDAIDAVAAEVSDVTW